METNRKMSDVEKWYEQEADQGETKHITKYVVKNMQDVKTLDVKILELRENPDNIQLLLDVISFIYDQQEQLIEAGEVIKDFDLVNYVLASALKADKIEPHDLGLVIAYLEQVYAPSIYFQYAILRVHQNLSKVKMIDIAMTISNAHHLQQEDKILKLIQRVQNYIEITNEKMLSGNQYNLKGLNSLYSSFAIY